MKQRLVIGISGASGAPLAVALLKVLKETDIETHVMITHGGVLTLQQECGMESIAELADVTLKERRKLVLVARETPFSTIHLRNLYELSQMGAVILSPMLSYYQKPESLEEATHHIVCKVLDQFGIEAPDYRRWEGMA